MSFTLGPDPNMSMNPEGASVAFGRANTGINNALATAGVGTGMLSAAALAAIDTAKALGLAALRNPTIANVHRAHEAVIRAYTIINQEFFIRVPFTPPRPYSATLPDDDEDVIDVPPQQPTPVAPVPTFLGVPLGVVFGVNAQNMAVAVGIQTDIGFSPNNPSFGWTDTFTITANDPNSAPTGVGAVPGAPGQGGTSATSDPTDSGPAGPGSPSSPDGSNW
jgi:hypothetical protein